MPRLTAAASDFVWTGAGSLAGSEPLAPVPWVEAVCERCRRLGFTGRLELVNQRGEQMVMCAWSGGERYWDCLTGEIMAGQCWWGGPAYQVGVCAGFRATQCVPDLDDKFTGGPTLSGRLDHGGATVEQVVESCRKHRLSCELELRKTAVGVVEIGFTRGTTDRLVFRAETAAQPGSPYRSNPSVIESTAEADILAALDKLSRGHTGGSFEVRLCPLFVDGMQQ